MGHVGGPYLHEGSFAAATFAKHQAQAAGQSVARHKSKENIRREGLLITIITIITITITIVTIIIIIDG